MLNWIKSLDRILRGDATRIAELRDGTLHFPVFGLMLLIDLLGLLYGVCMSVFAALLDHHWIKQIPASMVKVPALFLLTLLVTFPSLYVFNALVGSRLLIGSVMKLLVASLAVMLAVLASIGPIVAFFSFTTTNYSFMVILNVVVFGISGLLGLAFLLQTLHRMTIAMIAPAEPVVAVAPESFASPLDRSADHILTRHVKTVFRIWVIVFGLVGAQMAWVLRPFIGEPGKPFVLFCEPGSNFFEAVFYHLHNLLPGLGR